MSEPIRRFTTIDGAEYRLCLLCHSTTRWWPVRQFFATVSRAGDGIVWYLLMGALVLLGGTTGVHAAASMAVGGLIGLGVYKLLKRVLVRERPFVSHPGIECLTAPLDRYSFPSGHTLHAVLFGTLILSAFPGLYPVLLPFVGMIALSRVILGLHYPSDVAIGAMLGLVIAKLTQTLLPLAAFAPAG